MRRGDLGVKDHETFTSQSAHETERIAQFMVKKHLDKKLNKPLVFILDGDMGVGKTVFVKGVGRLLILKTLLLRPM